MGEVMNCEHGYKIGGKCPGCEHYDLADLRAEVARLRAELEAQQGAWGSLKAGHAIQVRGGIEARHRAEAAEAQVERLRAAAEKVFRALSNTAGVWQSHGVHPHHVAHLELKRAEDDLRAALSEPTPTGERECECVKLSGECLLKPCTCSACIRTGGGG